MFIGTANYYKGMWPSRAHILAPLTETTGNDKSKKARDFVWTKEMDIAFKRMKSLLAADVLLAYPNHNKPFNIYTDASDLQMGSVVMQEGRPVAYFSKKFSGAQLNYTTGEKEMLAIVESLKEFRTMLYGTELHIHTDHANLTFKTATSQSTSKNTRLHFITSKGGRIFLPIPFLVYRD